VLEGSRIRCPRHGALFDVTTGAALTLPAVSPLPTYAVRVENDDVFVD
jgi:3-phenylpropionate/trans-cinnamate dioxygenase ferredoxin subunit